MTTSNNYGLNNAYDYYEYVFDSSDTFNPAYQSHSVTDWPLFVFGRVAVDIAAIKVLEVQIPFSWYVFNEEISNFILTENGGAPITITIPPGNYNIQSLLATLKSVLDAASAFDYTLTYSGTSSTAAQTGKITITNNDLGVTANFSITFTNLDLPYYLGFTVDNNTTTNTFTSSQGANPTLVSPGQANVTGPNYVYLNSNTFGNLVNLYLPVGPTTSGILGPEIAKIPVNVQPGGVIFWQDPDPQKWYDVGGLDTLDQIDLYLGLGKSIAEDPLKLNGQPFSVKMGVLVQKRTSNTLVGAGAQNSRVERGNYPVPTQLPYPPLLRGRR